MIIGYSLFGTKDSIADNLIIQDKINYMELKNAIFDEMKIDETLLEYSIIKEVWGAFTVFLARFTDLKLNAGNVDFADLMVQNLILKRKKSEDFEWQDVTSWEFDKKKREYEYLDKTVGNYQPYEYTVLPEMADRSQGDPIFIEEITPEFADSFLIDKNNVYRIRYNIELNDLTANISSETIETLNGRFPITNSFGNLNYKSGQVSARLVGNEDEWWNRDMRKELVYRKGIEDFITNRNPKIFKVGNGEIWVVQIVGKPQLSPINDLNGLIYDIEFEWCQIADENDLDKLRRLRIL